MELLEIETYSDAAGNTVVCKLRKIFIEIDALTSTKQVVTIMDEVQAGPAGNKVTSFTMIADNTTLVPVFRQLQDGTIQPVMKESGVTEAGEITYEQETIGEFDMLEFLIFRNNFVSINEVVTSAVTRRKGLSNQPLAFINPLL